MKRKAILIWILRVIPALIMIQTLFFKFTAASESVYIFSALGMEPWGRIGTGIGELIASILILIPRTTVYGALLGLGIMSGAIFFHITKLGIVIMDDGGQLFIYALVTFVTCAALAILHRDQLLKIIVHPTKEK